MAKIRSIVFFILGFCLWCGAILMGPRPLMFFNLPSIFLGLGIPLFLMLAMHGFEVFSLKGENRKEMLQCWDRVIINSALGLAIIGGIQSLAMTTEPSQMGPPLAVASLTLFQAFSIRLFVITPLLKRSGDSMRTSKKTESKAA